MIRQHRSLAQRPAEPSGTPPSHRRQLARAEAALDAIKRTTVAGSVFILVLSTASLVSAGPASAARLQPASGAAVKPSEVIAGAPALADTKAAHKLTAPCAFAELAFCRSTNPRIKFYVVSTGNTFRCVITWRFHWGDGTKPTTVTKRGHRQPGNYFLAGHTYHARTTRSYLTVGTAVTATGGCTTGSGSQVFTLIRCRSRAGYCIPVDWNTKKTSKINTGVEPLNVILSSRSDVSMTSIHQAMRGWEGGCRWPDAVPQERANTIGIGYRHQNQAWREHGCLHGDLDSLTGREDQVRLWHQPVPHSQDGAWLIAASFVTACAKAGRQLRPLKSRSRLLHHPGSVGYCIDGGPGSYGTNGFNRGARTFVHSLIAAARNRGWILEVRIGERVPGTGQGHVSFSANVYVVTLRYR